MTEKPVILFTLERYDKTGGGVYEVVSQIAKRFAQNGYKVKVASTTSGDLFKPGCVIENGIEVHRFAIKGNLVLGIEGNTDEYRDFLLQQNYDVIVNYAAQQVMTDICLLHAHEITKTKIIIPCGYSGLYWEDFQDYFNKLPEYLLHYDAQIFHSFIYRDYNFAMQHGFKNLYLVPNGFDKEEIEIIRDNFRKKHNIGKNKKILLHVGNMTGTKGHVEALLVYLKARIKNSILVFIGKPLHPRSQYFIAFAKMMSWLSFNKFKILFLQYEHPYTIQAFKESDVFLFFSNIEYSPLVLFEAAAANLPFLASDCGNSREIAEWSGMGQIVNTIVNEKGFSKINLNDAVKKLRNIISLKDKSKPVTDFYETFNWDYLFKKYERAILGASAPQEKKIRPSIDVIIPAYNASNYIAETLQSVLNQSYPVNKIIVVDDGSSDNTVEIVKSFESPIITIIQLEKNKGVSTARNTGIQAASAEFLSFVDADDIWQKNKLEKQMQLFLNSSYNPGVVYCGYKHIDKDGNDISLLTVKPKLKGNIFKNLLLGNFISGSASSVLIKKSCIDDIGLFRTDLFYGEDWDYWLRLSKKYTFDYINEPLVKVRIHSQNAQHGKHDNKGYLKKFLDQELSIIAALSDDVHIPYMKYLKYFNRHYALSEIKGRQDKFNASLEYMNGYINYYHNYAWLTYFMMIFYAVRWRLFILLPLKKPL